MNIKYILMYDLYETGNYIKSFPDKESLEKFLREQPARKILKGNYSVISSEHIYFN